MNTQNDAIAIALANRRYLYQLLQRIFGHEPSLELLETVTGGYPREALGLLLDKDELAPCLNLFSGLKQEISSDAETVLDRLKSEYTYLMIGPNKLPAPPWESVYVTKERLILQESTLKVRRAYLEYQLLPTNYPHEADDHIAMELDFMAHLAKQSEVHFEEGNAGGLEKLLTDQKTFLEEHLMAWIGDFAEQIQSSKTHYFYPQMAALAARILRTDHTLLKEVISVMENKEERCNVNE